MGALELPVLLLNQNYEALNVCNVRRAVVLLGGGKAEMLENGRGTIHTSRQAVDIPSVIRLVYMVKRPVQQRRLSRQEVFLRDGYTCQYCGKQSKDLTIDHVMPRHRGGPHVWENVTSACIPCNHKKAGNTLKEARMTLLTEPRVPRPNPYVMFHHRAIQDEWRKFLPWLK